MQDLAIDFPRVYSLLFVLTFTIIAEENYIKPVTFIKFVTIDADSKIVDQNVNESFLCGK